MSDKMLAAELMGELEKTLKILKKIYFLEAKYNQVYKMLKRDLLKFHEFLVQIG